MFIFIVCLLIVIIIVSASYKDKAIEDEIAWQELKDMQADMIWKLSISDLVNIDHSRIYPESSDIVTDRIYDHMEEMSPAKIRNFIPKLKRFNEDMIQDARDMELG